MLLGILGEEDEGGREVIKLDILRTHSDPRKYY